MTRPIKFCFCGNMAEGSTDQCASHNAEDRKNERAASKVKVIRQVQKVTLKRSKELQEYSKLRREYLDLYPVCEVPECNSKAVEIHHMKGKENGLLLESDFFMAVCHTHHVFYTENSKEAIEKGISEIRSKK